MTSGTSPQASPTRGAQIPKLYNKRWAYWGLVEGVVACELTGGSVWLDLLVQRVLKTEEPDLSLREGSEWRSQLARIVIGARLRIRRLG